MKDDRKGYIIAGVLGFLTYFVGAPFTIFNPLVILYNKYLQQKVSMICMEIT